jgi:hypothetical protein
MFVRNTADVICRRSLIVRARISPVSGTEMVHLKEADGGTLAQDVRDGDHLSDADWPAPTSKFTFAARILVAKPESVTEVIS